MVKNISRYFDAQLAGKKIAFWSLAFNPNIDDIREASPLAMIEKFLEVGVKLWVFDPEAMYNIEKSFGNKIHYVRDMYEALDSAYALTIVTEWPEFHQTDFELMASRMRNKVIFDGRNILDHKGIISLGFYYEGVEKISSRKDFIYSIF